MVMEDFKLRDYNQHQLMKRAWTLITGPNLVFLAPTKKGLRNPIPKVARLNLQVWCQSSLSLTCCSRISKSSRGLHICQFIKGTAHFNTAHVYKVCTCHLGLLNALRSSKVFSIWCCSSSRGQSSKVRMDMYHSSTVALINSTVISCRGHQSITCQVSCHC